MHTHSPTPYCRLYEPATHTNLMLDGCSVDAFIVDVNASVHLSQRFTNHTSRTLSAVYAFGVMSGAAVCGFQMVRQDGTKIEGSVRGRAEAKEEYHRAVKEGKTAGLGQEETNDVFSISVGNVQPSETVTIHLRCLQPLIDDEKADEVKFIFPRTYAQRYGTAPTINAAAASTVIQPFLMNVIVQQAGPIKSVSCPSGHPISFSAGPAASATSSLNSVYSANVTLKDPKGFLAQDVILVISANNLDSPRCFIEPHPSPNHATTAMALTFVPKFDLPDVEGGMEYIFLIDRSGSMEGTNIRLVKDALVVLLRGLPSKDTTFNLVSFGSYTTKLWDISRPYSQDILEQATRHVDLMQANYGGTEIGTALQVVYSSLSKPLIRPVAVFILTDGSAWDVPICVSYTETALRTLPGPMKGTKGHDAKSFIQVFTVGIGSGASSDTCDSIARAGGGTAVYVQQGEEMVGKCARLVRAARTPPITIEVDWVDGKVPDVDTDEKRDKRGSTLGENFRTSFFKSSKGGFYDGPDAEKDDDVATLASEADTIVAPPAVNLFDSTSSNISHDTGPPSKPNLTLPKSPLVQQAPLTVPTIFPGTRTRIHAILSPPAYMKTDSFPSFIKVRGIVSITGQRVELDAPVTRLMSFPSAFFTSSSSSAAAVPEPFLHVLAADALITDRQNGIHAFSSSVADSFRNNTELKKAYMEKEIVRLGTTYGLTSMYTSFVAVDHKTFSLGSAIKNRFSGGRAHNAAPTVVPSSYVFPAHSYHQPQSQYPDPTIESYDPSIEENSYYYSQEEYGASSRPGQEDYAYARNPQPWTSPRGKIVSQSLTVSNMPAPRKKVMSFFSRTPSLKQVGHAVRASMSLSIPSVSQSAKNKRMSTGSLSSVNSPVSGNQYSKPVSHPSPPAQQATPAPKMTIGAQFTALARLQRFDGGFAWSTLLLSLIGLNLDDRDSVKQQLASQGISADMGATVLAWSWMEMHGGDGALDMLRKAKEWIVSQLEDGKDDTEEMKKKVLTLIKLP